MVKQVGHRESEDCGRAPFLGAGVEYRKRSARRLHWYIWMLQGHGQGARGHKGDLRVGAVLVTLVCLGTQTRGSQPVCGDVEAVGKYEVSKFTI